MNAPAANWDPYNPEYFQNPHPAFKRVREAGPVYYNEQYDFYALPRYDDVQRALEDRDTFISGRGGILEMIKANVTMPKGVFINEDPPLHGIHRGLLTRVFTPKRMTALGPQIREFCANALDPLIGGKEIDFVKHLGQQMPMRVIGMLLGIPDEDQQAVRQRTDDSMRTEVGQPKEYAQDHSFTDAAFEEYIDWRAKHPSNDLMTELLNAEFEDETGTRRKLERGEVMIFITILASAGNETTNRLIGWTGKVLGQHPDQRRKVHADRSLVAPAIEEILRFEPPAPHQGRYVVKDVEIHGVKIPKGSAVLMLPGAANRDPSKFENPDVFNVSRERVPHLSFGHGWHVCLGAALARVEGRIALDEVLNRFRDWEPDLEKAKLAQTSTIRGWETMPAFIQ